MGVEANEELFPQIFSEDVLLSLAQEEIAQTHVSAERLSRPEVKVLVVDPEGCMDHDDGFWAKRLLGGGYLLTVSIADVAEVVPQGSAIEMLAQMRGFSRYANGKAVTPMLPPELSEGTVSLIAGEKRPSITMKIRLDSSCRVKRFSLHETTLISPGNYSYEDAFAIAQDKTNPYYHMLQVAIEISRGLQDQREARGRGRRFSIHTMHEVIEEFMIITNRLYAVYEVEHNLPILYRSHPGIMAEFDGLDVPKNAAYYGPVARGHSGLGVERYAQLTSPIRRATDLTDQRVIKQCLRGESPEVSSEMIILLAQYINGVEREMKQQRRVGLPFFEATAT